MELWYYYYQKINKWKNVAVNEQKKNRWNIRIYVQMFGLCMKRLSLSIYALSLVHWLRSDTNTHLQETVNLILCLNTVKIRLKLQKNTFAVFC